MNGPVTSALLVCLVLAAAAAAAQDFKPVIAAAAAAAAPAANDDPYTSPRTRWFRDAKFGMFIHWGLYAVPAGQWEGKAIRGAGEWIMNDQRIPIDRYQPLARQFNPTKFDAKEWVRVAKDAGMKYVVITSKHHDGFCMWDSAFTSYDVADATPFKRDPMAELAKACRDAGLRFGFYHSIMDWHHPELAGYWNAKGGAAKDPNDPRVVQYVETQLKPQLKELVIKYDPAVLWFDGEWVPWWTEERGRDIERMLRQLKPDIVVNNRVGKRKMTDGDYETPEQEIPAAALGHRLWETCMTLNDTWGYKSADQHWKSSNDVIRKLADIAGKGGNFLLNVGPTAEGVIPEASVKILGEVGEWTRANGEAIYGTTFATAAPPKWGAITRKGNAWNLIVFDWPTAGEPLAVPVLTPVKSARLLGAAGEVKVIDSGGEQGARLRMPDAMPVKPATVVVLEFAEEPKALAAAGPGGVVHAGIDRSYTLPAGAATLRGNTLKLEPAGNVGFWTDASDFVEWQIEPKAPAKYDVSLTYAAAPDTGGAFTVSIGNQTLEGKIEPTGGWQQYKTVKLGQITIPAGRATVSVKPKGEFKTALMNLQSLKLDPAR